VPCARHSTYISANKFDPYQPHLSKYKQIFPFALTMNNCYPDFCRDCLENSKLENLVFADDIARCAAAWHIYVMFHLFSRQERKKWFCEGFTSISNLELRGSSLRLFLMFVTHFFHLIITIIKISWSQEEI
jgi:hypothetical protein